MAEKKSNYPLVIAGAAVVAVTVVGSILWAKSRSHNATIKEAGDRPDKIIMAAQEGKITEAERDQALKETMQSHLSKQVDDYFALADGKPRNDYLDKIIDMQEKAKVHMEAAQKSGEIDPAKIPEGVHTKVTESPDGTRKEMRMTVKSKGDASNLPPELRAKVAEFAAAIAKRRAERGLPPGPGNGMGVVVVREERSK